MAFKDRGAPLEGLDRLAQLAQQRQVGRAGGVDRDRARRQAVALLLTDISGSSEQAQLYEHEAYAQILRRNVEGGGRIADLLKIALAPGAKA